MQDSGYFRAKMAQENLVRGSGIPYTIVHSTQFLDFLGAIAKDATDGQTVRISPAYVQPIASDDVDDGTLVPGDGARLGSTRFEDWFRQSSSRHIAAQ